MYVSCDVVVLIKSGTLSLIHIIASYIVPYWERVASWEYSLLTISSVPLYTSTTVQTVQMTINTACNRC